MQFIEVASQVIPGYVLLSQEQQNAFEQTEVGRKFVDFVNQILLAAKVASENAPTGLRGWWSYLSGQDAAKRRAQEDAFLCGKQELIGVISESRDYKLLINQIIYKILERDFSDFLLLNPQQKSLLASAAFSKPLQLLEISAEKKAIMDEWRKNFYRSDELAALRERITQQRAPECANRLARYLPILNNSLPDSDRSPVEQYIAEYFQESRKEEPDFDQMEEVFLTAVIYYHLQQATLKRIRVIDLQNFNHKQANLIAKEIRKAIADEKELAIEQWLTVYQNKLNEHINRRLRLINGRIRKITPQIEENTGVLGSLSYLFWNSRAVNRTTEFFNKLADAHAFIQYTGMSTQNESSFLVIVDIYNYFRAAEQIKETSSVLFSLAKPFLPLYQEYKEIGLYEKNIYRKVFRSIMPLLIIAGVVVLIAALLAPLGIPELAFLVVVIPALFLGLFLASKYVTLKNELYQYLRNKYYGGPYEIPEFQINARMTHIFRNEETAEMIREIYLDELKACDELDKSYQMQWNEGLLDDAGVKLRRENVIKRHGLLLEWYDIHSNNELGIDNVPQIVEKRLNDIADEETKMMEKVIDEHDMKKVRRRARDIVNEVKAVLRVAPIEHDESNSSRTDNSRRQRATVDTVQSSAEESRVRFFTPKSAPHQAKAAKMEGVVRLLHTNPTPTELVM